MRNIKDSIICWALTYLGTWLINSKNERSRKIGCVTMALSLLHDDTSTEGSYLMDAITMPSRDYVLRKIADYREGMAMVKS